MTADDGYPGFGYLPGWRWCSLKGDIEPWEEGQEQGCQFCPDDSTALHWRLLVEHACSPREFTEPTTAAHSEHLHIGPWELHVFPRDPAHDDQEVQS